MKRVEAIIEPSRLDEVKKALCELEIFGMTVAEAIGFGRFDAETRVYRGLEYAVDSIARVHITVIVPDDLTPQVIEAIQARADAGSLADGKVFVSPVDDAIRIRTGERSEDAL